MQEKQDKKDLEADTFRYKILPLFSTNVQIHKFPLCAAQIILEVVMFIQILKFPIDYFSVSWFGYYQPIFSYLDLSFYEKYMSTNGYQSSLILVLVIITSYWMGVLSLFLIKFKYEESSANTRRMLLLFFSTVLLLPILNTLLNLFNCQSPTFFRSCMINQNSMLTGLSFFTFSVFLLMIIIQSFIRFQFIEDQRIFKRIKNSSYISVGLILYTVVNQLTFFYLSDMVKLIVLDFSILLMLMIFLLKDQHYQEWTKLLQLNMLVVNIIPIAMINIIYFMNVNINFTVLLILWPISIVSIQRMNLHTLEFELDNINKWNTPAMMIRYAETLRKLLKRKDDYFFEIHLHGYMQIHKQKCDNPTCPFNVQLIRNDQLPNKSEKNLKKSDEVLRTEGIIKKIFNDGCKIAPINPDLQLQYAHFLFDIEQKEASLKHLLLIKYDDLAFDKYYKYVSLKDKIHNQMCEKPERQFLDLVSELEVKRKQEEIAHKFQQAALINLEFWSVLNEDHPDFQKLNQIGSSRVRIGQEVRQRYQDICQYAHSQKITNLYVHFLTSIQNNEDMYNKIYDQIKKKYHLEEKIILQDWSNSSLSTLLVSIETINYGTMIDLNSTCASMFGYEKYQVVNRHFKTIFSQDLRDQIKSFLSPKIRDQIFFMSHKNSYLLKIIRKVQTYNSMQTGMTSICTLNNMVSLNSCFIVFNKDEKALGLSSTCIALLGLDYKTFQQALYLKDIINFSLEDVKKISINGNQSFKLQQLLKLQQQSSGTDYRKDPYTITYHSYPEGLFWIQFTLTRSKFSYKNVGTQAKKFQFQVQTTLSDFKYIGVSQSDQHPFLSQFSQLNFSETLKNQHIASDYGQNITILRLKQNIIQVIQEHDDELSEMNQKKQSQALRQDQQNLARKDQQAIFQSKETFEKFISDYKITKSIRLILLVGIIFAIGAYVAFYFIFKADNEATIAYFGQIAYQNLIIGTIAKEYALITTLQLMKAQVSLRVPTSFYATYMGNVNYVQSIKLLGSSPYPLTTYISANNSRQFYSDEFLLSFINYAVNMAAGMTKAVTQPDLVAAYNSVQPFKVEYLKVNGIYTRDSMFKALQVRIQQIMNKISFSMNVQLMMLIAGVTFLLILSIILALIISSINNQKIRALQIFLGINEIQIQKFSSKTEKFLISLHVEDTTGQIEMDDENDGKKTNSSTFAKKKRFKLVKLSKAIYIKILLIPLLAQAFFIQSFMSSYTSLQFMYDSIPYVALTSKADYIFYKGIGVVQNAILTHGTSQVGLTNDYLQYYRDYFDVHYQTFGLIDQFHQSFTNVFMENICDGQIAIAGACDISTLSKNGTLLIFTDITVRTQKSDFSIDFTNDYYVAFSVISATHKYLTMLILSQQQKQITTFETNLLNYLIIWIFVMIGVSLIYGLYTINSFIKEVNENKNMIMLLPVSIAKTLPDVKKYINMILAGGSNC